MGGNPGPGRAPRESEQQSLMLVGHMELVRLRRPFIRRGHSLRPRVSPDG